MLFLHGIFGTGGNWRTIARRWVALRPTWGAVLVDLRMHGRSQGLRPALVQWLAMNVVREGDHGYRYGLDLDAVRALLDDYFARDLWPVVEAPPGRVRVELVAGARSNVLDAEDLARARRVSAARP